MYSSVKSESTRVKKNWTCKKVVCIDTNDYSHQINRVNFDLKESPNGNTQINYNGLQFYLNTWVNIQYLLTSLLWNQIKEY